MIAGGLLLLVLAINILLFGGWKEKLVSPKSVGAVPIACPLLVGPGAITTTILILQTSGIAVTLIAVVIIFAVIWGILRLIEPIYKVLGETGAAVIARIMAIFIAAIAVGFVIDGVTYYIRP
jgi:multiple antibiotic resistance protein